MEEHDYICSHGKTDHLILHSFRLEADCGLQFVKAVCDMMTEKFNCEFCINIVSRINTSETS